MTAGHSGHSFGDGTYVTLLLYAYVDDWLSSEGMLSAAVMTGMTYGLATRYVDTPPQFLPARAMNCV